MRANCVLPSPLLSPTADRYDIDATDPGIAPSTGTPVRGGLTYREAHYIAEEIAATGRMASMDMVEVDPVLSAGGKETVELATALIGSAHGKRII
jgi:arginase